MKISLNDLKAMYYKLHDLIRFQSSPRISNESVLEHSGYVAAIVVKLHDIYDFNLEDALKLAIFHDFPEVAISDIPHNIKQGLSQEVRDALDTAEYDFLEKHLDSTYVKLLQEFNDFSSVVGLVVAYADVISVAAYAEREILLGNSRYFFENIIPLTEARTTKLVDLLAEYKRKDHNNSALSADIRSTIEKDKLL